MKRFLARLTFRAYDDSFSCNKDDLIRLGQRVDPVITDPISALEVGAQQFKVNFEQLREIYAESTWARENVLIAVAGSETDGSGGMREGADATLRKEVEKFAHVIFAGSPAQREFWLGMRSASADELRQEYGGLKPCIHGCDAHEVRTVGITDGERNCWIKGAIEFDALRQACIDPGGRAYVGLSPPVSTAPSQTIASVEIKGAPWVTTPKLALNPSLIAIIGARGSGKTALADMIALGCDAISEPLSPASFLDRARDLVQNASVSLRWQGGEETKRKLDGLSENSPAEYKRARYLSQQFVEELCSAQGMTDRLMQEIQRVIFEAHPRADRDGAVDFDELLESRARRFREARDREEEGLADISERLGTELEKIQMVDSWKKQIEEKRKQIDRYLSDRAKLVTKDNDKRVTRLIELTAAAEKIKGHLRFYKAQEQSLLSLKDEVGNVRLHQAPETLRRMQERHKPSRIDADEWKQFLLDYTGDVDAPLTKHLAGVRETMTRIRGTQPAPASESQSALIPDDVPLDTQTLALLEAEIARLEKLVSADRETANKFSALSKRISDETATLERLKEKLTDCEGAKARAKVLALEREATYVRVFDAIKAEQDVLSELYAPLMARLGKAEGTLKKLSFTVGRHADVENWGKAGEVVLDLRLKGPFKGRGTLRQLAEAALKDAWETGDPQTVSESMARFRSDNQDELLDDAAKAEQSVYRAWSKRFAKWLYGTSHITIQYSIDYDGVDIRKLSPGTRGIVLLLLYLALDEGDDRPLIIDQPEENLDPKSIHDELVNLFLEAKGKRQVIMVTHNANLVVNTDADQIIIAQAGAHLPGELPPLTYLSGGLESSHIRKAVCDILEGGELAFIERARRLRVRLER